MPNVEDLEVYHRSHAVVLQIYQLTEGSPESEKYGLTRQMRRSAASVPTNLAEGCGRSSDRELRRFVDIAQGSLTELRYQMKLAADLGFAHPDSCGHLHEEVAEVGRMLHGFRRRLLG
jgi:four helix bundle protein